MNIFFDTVKNAKDEMAVVNFLFNDKTSPKKFKFYFGLKALEPVFFLLD